MKLLKGLVHSQGRWVKSVAWFRELPLERREAGTTNKAPKLSAPAPEVADHVVPSGERP